MKTEKEVKNLIKKYEKVISASNDGMVKLIYAKRRDDLKWVIEDDVIA